MPKDRVFRGALSLFEKAVRVHEMRGALPPEDHKEIEENYAKTKAKLITMVEGS